MKQVKCLATLAFVAALTGTGLAQSDQGRFSATVRDSSNAFVPGASVSLKNERTGETRAAATNTDGFALVSALKPSTYTIRVEKGGGSRRSSTRACRLPSARNWRSISSSSPPA